MQIDVTSLNPIIMIKQVKRLHKLINEKKIDIVHCHHRMAALYIRVYRTFYKIPMVYTLHLADVPADFLHRTMTYIGDKAIGVSAEVSNFLVEKLGVPKDKVVTICNGVDESLLSPLSEKERAELLKKWDIPDNVYIFAMHSRIEKVKNHMLVVDALLQLPEEIKKMVKIVCSGSKKGAYYEALVNRISECGLEDVFRFTGWTNTRDILGVADALILPSTNEGFPLSVIEAFLMKIPVLRTRTGGFDDQKYCLEIKLNDPTEVANTICWAVKNTKGALSTQTEEAFEYAISNFTIEQMTNKTVDIYKEVLNTDIS